LKKELLTPADYAQVLAVMTQLNRPGATLAHLEGVQAITDVTGFGLLGHLLELCQGSGVRARLDYAQIPILPAAQDLAQLGIFPGAARRNWEGYGALVQATALEPWEQLLLADPQTSGGLLLAVDPALVPTVLSQLEDFPWTRVIGHCEPGPPGIQI